MGRPQFVHFPSEELQCFVITDTAALNTQVHLCRHTGAWVSLGCTPARAFLAWGVCIFPRSC